jgi:MFS transporter, UMF1 family
MYLKPRPGPPLEEGNTCLTRGKVRWLTKGVVAIADAIRSARQLPNTLIFLVLYFIYSDGYGTIGSVGVLFATENMCMGSMSMGLLVLEISVAAILGGFFVLWFQKKYDIRAKTVVVACLSIYCLLPLYGLLGFATPDDGLGLKNEWEMFVFGLVYGSMLGAVQSYTRTVFSDLTPPGREAEFFSLYEITDKGSSWMGPLIVGIMHGQTGEIRYSFFYILAVMIVPILGLIFLVDHEAGMKAVGRLHDELKDGDERDDVIFSGGDGSAKRSSSGDDNDKGGLLDAL